MRKIKKRLRFRVITVLFLLCSVFLYAACSNDNRGRNQGGNTESNPENIYENSVNAIEVFGYVKILKYRNISLDFPVRIEKIHVVSGQLIKKNDPLISLNLDEFYNDIRVKEHELSIENLKLLNLEQEYSEQNKEVSTKYMTLSNSIEIAEKEELQLEEEYEEISELLLNDKDPEIQRLKIDIEQARQDYEKAGEELARKKILYEAAAISEQEYNEYSYNYKQKELAVQNLEYLLESTLLNKNRDLEQINLQIEQKNAELDDLRVQIENLNNPEITQIEIQKEACSLLEYELDYLYKKSRKGYLSENIIVSDMESGIVSEILCMEGEIISSGYNIISLIDAESLYVEANVPEEFVKDIMLGNSVNIIPLADQDRKYSGIVTYIGSMAVETRGETIVPVHIKVNDNDGFLLPNFNVDIEIIPDK